ncbi:amidohydrolase [Thermosulfurimonas marina]|uniref:5-methylthioadenosine/S-adenosylhomocysteine deaminase n=1 Tax=Thermosulfurimonas marina TaxID=2047767 RepID=A0A6H1WUE2_9BACT|nr:amidohydrolase [Thermosulfurimonas marina]QJA06769.1 amidohydrolase [Thermosulfurimonas marina]
MREEKLIKATWVLPAWDREPLYQGAIFIRKERIIEVGPAQELRERYPAVPVEDLGEALIFPGLVNAHTHASMTIFRGLAEDLPLMTWLHEYIFPVESRLRSEWVYWGAKLALCEMLRSGITAVCDMYLFEPYVIRAVEEAGVRAALGEGLFDFPSPGYGPLEEGLRLTEDLLRAFAGHPRIRVMVMPHAVYTCSPETLKKAARLAERYGARLHIHLSETAEEVSQCLERYGRRPVAHLEVLGLLGENLHVAHAVELTDEEIELLARKGVSVAHCPESNLKLGSGVARVPEMLEAGVRVTLGTDGPASNNDLDLLSEMRTAALLQKGLRRDPTVLPAREILRMATEEGARALGFERCGRLEPGYEADLAVLDLTRPDLAPVHDPLALLVYSARAGAVREVMVAGQWLMREGQILTLDEEETRHWVAGIAQEIREFLGKS